MKNKKHAIKKIITAERSEADKRASEASEQPTAPATPARPQGGQWPSVARPKAERSEATLSVFFF